VLWLLSPAELVQAWQGQRLGGRQLVLAGAEQLEPLLRQALDVVIEPQHWDQLRRAVPQAGPTLLTLHERLSRRVLAHPRSPDSLVALGADEQAPLRHLLQVLAPLPQPWARWLEAEEGPWTSWARVDPQLLQWTLHRQPLEPLAVLSGLLLQRGAVVIGQLPAQHRGDGLPAAAQALGLTPQVDVLLGDTPLADPLPLFALLRQPLPNSPLYGEHLLEQSRRLVLGQDRLTVVLADDSLLLRQLGSGLAAEFGSRVVHQCNTPDGHGVLCASWSWWLQHQERLPLPGQVVVALLPIASLEDPLTAARVAVLRQQGRDWFRELLLPDGLIRLQRGVAGLRRSQGRLAILDGRLRGRSWGRQVLQALEPWVNLTRLMPH
jgi:ATP-dependent DNA helicase DinG